MTWSESPRGTDVSLSRSVGAGGESVGQGIKYLPGFQNSVLGAASLDPGGELLVTPNPWLCSRRGT